MDYAQFLKPELLIVVAVLIFIGMIIKNINKISDELIPLIITVFGVLIVCLFYGNFSVNTVLQGIIAAASAIYGNQVFKQSEKLSTKKDNSVDTTATIEAKPSDVQ